MNTHRFVWLLSHDEVNQDLAYSLGAAYGLDVQTRFLKEGLPDGDCRALVVDLDSVAPGRSALQRLVKELCSRPHPYPVAAFCYSLEDDQLMDLRAAGIQVFQHGLSPAVFAAIAEQTSHASSDGVSAPSSRVAVTLSAACVSISWKSGSRKRFSVRSVISMWAHDVSQLLG
jgi:hypothetical protein